MTAAGSARLRSGAEAPRPNTSVAASRWLQLAPSDVTSVAAANAPRDFGTRALALQLSQRTLGARVLGVVFLEHHKAYCGGTEKLTMWDEYAIVQLKGREESLRLEFKAGALLDKVQSIWVADISKEVSAFANTEGGTLVLGLTEEKIGRTRVGGEIDGVPKSITREQLQRLIEGNLSPYLVGIRVHRIDLSLIRDRAVFVVEIPQGTTAYQANDGRYYGRSEIEAKFLPDHEVRLRMWRGKAARASLSARAVAVTMSEHVEQELREKHAVPLDAFRKDADAALRRFPELLDIMNADRVPDIIEYDLILRNDGEITIRDPAIEAEARMSEALLGEGVTIQYPPPDRYEMTGQLIYPGDERVVPDSRAKFRCRRAAELNAGDHFIKWKVFLDNSPPSEGVFDLATFLQSARDEALPRTVGLMRNSAGA